MVVFQDTCITLSILQENNTKEPYSFAKEEAEINSCWFSVHGGL